MAEDDIKSFTSWKLRLWDALSMDRELSPTERLLAFRLLQHANAETKAIFPTQKRLAIQLGVSVDTVKRGIGLIVKRGWLKKSRKNRRQSNRYQFDETLIDKVIDEVNLHLADDLLRGQKRTLKKAVKGQKCPVTKGQKRTLTTGQKCPPNTLSDLPTADHLNNQGTEQEGTESQYGTRGPRTLKEAVTAAAKKREVEVKPQPPQRSQSIPEPSRVSTRTPVEDKARAHLDKMFGG